MSVVLQCLSSLGNTLTPSVVPDAAAPMVHPQNEQFVDPNWLGNWVLQWVGTTEDILLHPWDTPVPAPRDTRTLFTTLLSSDCKASLICVTVASVVQLKKSLIFLHSSTAPFQGYWRLYSPNYSLPYGIVIKIKSIHCVRCNEEKWLFLKSLFVCYINSDNCWNVELIDWLYMVSSVVYLVKLRCLL